jgi:hypothetical protein
VQSKAGGSKGNAGGRKGKTESVPNRFLSARERRRCQTALQRQTHVRMMKSTRNAVLTATSSAHADPEFSAVRSQVIKCERKEQERGGWRWHGIGGQPPQREDAQFVLSRN